MRANPVLRKLGLSERDRAVILHADDIGMCRASLAAYRDLVDFGLISAASTMVPCSWFPATAAFCRAHGSAAQDGHETIDMGVHLTLTSEWEAYRWGPISTRDPSSGLVDEEGYFYTRSKTAQAHADPTAVQVELEAQVERALTAGIDVTHIDTHMGSALHPQLLGIYLQVAMQYRVPPFLLRLDEAGLKEIGIDPALATLFAGQVQTLEETGLPLLDGLHVMPLNQPEDRVEQVIRTLEAIPAGITYLVIHPAEDTPELRAIATDWRCRVADYQAFTSESLRAYVRESGIHILGWRTLRDLMRSAF